MFCLVASVDLSTVFSWRAAEVLCHDWVQYMRGFAEAAGENYGPSAAKLDV